MLPTPSTESSDARPALRRGSIDCSFGTVSYLEAGSGRTAVFVHGVLLNGWLWEGVIAEVAGDRRCVAPDLLGHGETESVGPGQDLSFGSQADMLIEVIAALDVGPVDLVGNDSGGAICQIIAARRPDLVRTMTLTNCDTYDNVLPSALVAFRDACIEGRALAIFEPMLEDLDLARSFLPATLHDPASVDNDFLRRVAEPLVRNERRERSIERWMTDLTARDLLAAEALLAQHAPPTLIVWGTDDEFFPIGDAHRLAELLPSTTDLVEVPGGRLFHPLEQPTVLAEHLKKLWRGETQP